MELNELKLLVNRLRRYYELNENGSHDDRIQSLREQIANILKNSEEKVTIKCEGTINVYITDFDYDYLIDNLVDNPHKSLTDVIVDDIDKDLNSYIILEDIHISVEDEKGNILNYYD